MCDIIRENVSLDYIHIPISPPSYLSVSMGVQYIKYEPTKRIPEIKQTIFETMPVGKMMFRHNIRIDGEQMKYQSVYKQETHHK